MTTIIPFPPDAAKRRQAPPRRPARIIRLWPRAVPPKRCNPPTHAPEADDLLAEPVSEAELARAELAADAAIRKGREAARRAFELLRQQRRLISSLTPAGLPGDNEEAEQ